MVALGLPALSSCGGALTARPPACGPGRTELDGVCVSEKIADYVSCVRAQGAQLGQDRSKKLAAEAGYLGVKAAAASDVSDKLEKKYSVSSEAELQIVQACSAAAGLAAPPSALQQRPASGPIVPPPAPLAQAHERGLLAGWSFDETDGDTAYNTVSDGERLDLTLDPGIERVEGRVGRGLLFRGGSLALRSGSQPGPHSPRELTIALWLKQTTPGDSVLVFKGSQPDRDDSNNREFLLWVRSTGAVQFGFVTEASAGKNGWFLTTDGQVIVPGRWIHLTATLSRDSLVTSIYIDGAVRASFTGFDPSRSSVRRVHAPLWIGNGFKGALGFAGTLDDVRIYGRALGAAEIAVLARTR